MSLNTGQPLYDAAHWRRLRELIACVNGRETGSAADILREASLANPKLAADARALLALDADEETEELAGAMPRALPDPPADPPTQVGPFRLLRLLGRGGMGEVHLAERANAEFTQRVALKLLDGHALRMPRLVGRERRALAALSHPNITAFIDAGADARYAWMAMEYVDGLSLLEHCRQQGLDLRARVRLFEQVCMAVAHAHSQRVVHRDLKPSNVLVASDGTVKLLDFGIALILEPDADQTSATRVFTPEYAAPEQLRGEPTTTATDIHALGLMLFELVSGTRLSTLDRTSTSEDWTTAELERAATTTPHSLATRQDLRGDLGRIIAHAISPAPERRYASSLHLRDDLRRWLEYRPLAIARPSAAYVATRFVARNLVAVSIAGFVALALIGTTGFALWQARNATRMAVRAEHSRAFMVALLNDANPFQPTPATKGNVDLLERAAKRIDNEFFSAPEEQLQLRQIVANALARVGESKLATQLQERNLEQARQLHGERSSEVGVVLANLAQTREDSGDIEAARSLFEQSWGLLENAGDAYRDERMATMTGLAKMANRRSDFSTGQRWYERVLRERIAHEGPESPAIAMDLYDVGACALYQEHYQQARALMQRAHAMLARTLGPDHARFAYVDLGLGLAQSKTGDVDAGSKTLANALRIARANFKPGAAHIGIVQSALGQAQWLAGDLAAARTNLQSAIAILHAAKSPALGNAELNLGRVQLQDKDPAALQTLATAREQLQADISRAAGNAGNLALAQAAHGAAMAQAGNAVAGEHQARVARAQLLALHPAGGEKLGWIDAYLADILAAQGLRMQARAQRELAVVGFRQVYGDPPIFSRAQANGLDAMH